MVDCGASAADESDRAWKTWLRPLSSCANADLKSLFSRCKEGDVLFRSRRDGFSLAELWESAERSYRRNQNQGKIRAVSAKDPKTGEPVAGTNADNVFVLALRTDFKDAIVGLVSNYDWGQSWRDNLTLGDTEKTWIFMSKHFLAEDLATDKSRSAIKPSAADGSPSSPSVLSTASQVVAVIAASAEPASGSGAAPCSIPQKPQTSAGSTIIMETIGIGEEAENVPAPNPCASVGTSAMTEFLIFQGDDPDADYDEDDPNFIPTTALRFNLQTGLTVGGSRQGSAFCLSADLSEASIAQSTYFPELGKTMRKYGRRASEVHNGLTFRVVDAVLLQLNANDSLAGSGERNARCEDEAGPSALSDNQDTFMLNFITSSTRNQAVNRNYFG